MSVEHIHPMARTLESELRVNDIEPVIYSESDISKSEFRLRYRYDDIDSDILYEKADEDDEFDDGYWIVYFGSYNDVSTVSTYEEVVDEIRSYSK